jgi:hypothetical protein
MVFLIGPFRVTVTTAAFFSEVCDGIFSDVEATPKPDDDADAAAIFRNLKKRYSNI